MTTDIPMDVRIADTLGRSDGRGQEERTVRHAGSESSRQSVSPMPASSVCRITKLGLTALWSNTRAQMAHLLLQEELPMEHPEKYLEEVYRKRLGCGKNHWN